MTTTAVLGAGLAGLTAARTLQQAGHDVVVIDKGRGVGGRLATRRIGEAVLDHGAQFFTVRGDDFRAVVDEARAAGVVAEWCRGFGVDDSHPRYFCPAGMTSLAKWLATDLDVRTGHAAWAIAEHPDGVTFLDADRSPLATAQTAVVTAPIPQMLALFDNGEIKLGHDLASDLKSITYFATLGLLAVVEGPSPLPEPGGVQFDHGPFTFIADNERKGVSPVRALTFHAAHDWSLRRIDDDPTEVHAELLEMAAPWLSDNHVIASQLKTWRYAGPVTPLPERTRVLWIAESPVALAGDAFGGPKVEGAFNSGLAAAHAILNERSA